MHFDADKILKTLFFNNEKMKKIKPQTWPSYPQDRYYSTANRSTSHVKDSRSEDPRSFPELIRAQKSIFWSISWCLWIFMFSICWCSWTRCLDAKISARMWIQKLIFTEIEPPDTWLIPGLIKFKIECRNSSRKFGQSTGTQQSFKFCKNSNWKLKIYRRCPRVPEWWRGPDWSEVILNRGADKFHALWRW